MSLWVPVVAAFGASILTSLATLALEWLRRRDARKSQTRQVRLSAYIDMIQAANGVLMTGVSTRALLQSRSGLASSLSEALRLRRPIDDGELAWRMKDELQPILDAQAAVLTCGTPAAAAASRDVVETAVAYVYTATSMTERQRMLMGIVKWRPDERQEKAAQTRLEAVGDAVRAFVAIARRDLGEAALASVVALPPGAEPSDA